MIFVSNFCKVEKMGYPPDGTASVEDHDPVNVIGRYLSNRISSFTSAGDSGEVEVRRASYRSDGSSGSSLEGGDDTGRATSIGGTDFGDDLGVGADAGGGADGNLTNMTPQMRLRKSKSESAI